MDENVIETILEKNPLLRRQRDKLEAMKPGTFCSHKTFGFGEIIGYDNLSGKLLINFSQKPGHSIDPAFALKHVELLREGHILIQFKQDAAGTIASVKSDPADALKRILEHSKDCRATVAEINEILLPILGEKQLKSWWPRAKKEADADANIAQPEVRTGYFVLREQPIEQIDELIDGVLLSKQISKKISNAAKLLAEKKFGEQREKLLLILEELERLLQTSVADWEKLQLFWLCEDFSLILGCELPEQISLEVVLQGIQDMTEAANQLSSAHLVRLLGCIKSAHPEHFSQMCLLLIRSGAARTVGAAVDFLLGHGLKDLLQSTLLQWLRDNSLRAILLEWILRNRKQRKYGELLEPLITPALFRAALITIDQEALKRSNNRKISLGETLAEDQRLVDEISAGQSANVAHDLAHMVLLSQGFDLLTKKSIVARFIRLFPGLQKLLDGNLSQSASEASLKVSQESLDAIKQEYETIVHEKIPANKEAVEVAREQGDLRENSEYKMARQDQDMLLARKAQIEKDLMRVEVIDFSDAGTEAVSLGCVVTLSDEKGKVEKYAVLGAWDSNPQRRIVSYQTPLGRALLGKKVGDAIEVENQAPRQITKIERWADGGNKL